jgi:hypothetical protein
MRCVNCGQNKPRDAFRAGRRQAICTDCLKANRQDFSEQSATIELTLDREAIFIMVLGAILLLVLLVGIL